MEILTGIIIFAGIILVIYLVEVLMIPSEATKQKKKKREPAAVVAQDERLEQKYAEHTSRLEHHIQNLKRQIEEFERVIKEKDKEILIEKTKGKKYQEKLSQEREWHGKEEGEVNKVSQEALALRKELKSVQENLNKEHSTRIKFEKEFLELKSQWDSLNDQRRRAEAEAAGLKAREKDYVSEIAGLKKETAELLKKRDETKWIAVSDYLALEKKFKEQERDLIRLSKEVDRIKNEIR